MNPEVDHNRSVNWKGSNIDNDFNTALDTFVTRLQTHINEYVADKYTNLQPDVIEVEHGKKFVKVVRCRWPAGGKSVHCFIAKVDNTTKALGTIKKGDVLKAANWNAPAKHVRGTIFTDNFANYGVNTYGACYIR